MPHSFHHRLNGFSCAQAAAITAAIAFLLYLPTLQFQFVNWDDDGYVTANQALAYRWRDFAHWAFTTFAQGNWHPLTWISLKIDYSFWGMNPLGYHLSNIIFHAVNSSLVVVLMWRLFSTAVPQEGGFRRVAFAFVTGLVFAIHPLHVESVAWISERKDLLYAFFYLLSVLTWLVWTQKEPGRRISLYLLSLLFCVLSLMSKPMAVSLPVVLLLLDIYPLRRTGLGGRLILEKLPFVALALVSCVITIIAQAQAQSVAPMLELALFDRFGNAAQALFFYLYKSFVPLDLSPLYQLRSVDFSLMVKGVVAAFGFIVLVSMAIARFKKSPAFLVLLSMFLVMLLPVLGIVQVGSQSAADRYMYLALLPLSVGGCLLVSQLARKLTAPPSWLVFPVLVCGLILAFLTVQQSMHWRNSELLWKKVLTVDYEVPVAHYNLGNYYLAVNQLDKAEAEWRATIQLDPGYSRAHNQLGNLHFLKGDLNAALDRYRKAVASDPGNVEAVYNYAQVLDQLGMIRQAKDAYSQFIRLATTEYQEQIEVASGRIKQIDGILPP